MCMLVVLFFSCSNDEKLSTEESGSNAPLSEQSEQKEEYTAVPNTTDLEPRYYVPSDYDILNAPPASVTEYLQQHRKDVDTILNELDIDVEEEIGKYLQEEYESTKDEIFSRVP